MRKVLVIASLALFATACGTREERKETIYNHPDAKPVCSCQEDECNRCPEGSTIKVVYACQKKCCKSNCDSSCNYPQPYPQPYPRDRYPKHPQEPKPVIVYVGQKQAQDSTTINNNTNVNNNRITLNLGDKEYKCRHKAPKCTPKHGKYCPKVYEDYLDDPSFIEVDIGEKENLECVESDS